MSTENSFYKRHAHIFVAAGVLLCFSVVFAGLIAAYVYKFDRQLAAENRTHLAEISNYIAAHMTTVVADTQESMKAVAAAVTMLDSEQERMAYLTRIAAQYSFIYMGYAGPDGMLHATIGSESVDISRERYFRNALYDKSTVSNQLRKIFSNRAASGIILAVPLRKGEQRGALVAMLETKSLRKTLSTESFGGEGYAYIIDASGTVVMRTKSLDFGNLIVAWRGLRFEKGYSLNRFAGDVAASRDGLTCYVNMVGARHYAYYHALPFNNWTVVNIISEQAISGETLMLTRELGIIGGSIVTLFMILMLWVMRTQRISQESRVAAEAKSAFLANMSHEIRTPMNAIVGLSEIMLRDETAVRHRDQLTSILNSGKGLLAIINDILDISKIEAGRFTIIDDPYELESLLYDLTIIVAIRIGEKPLQFLVEIDPALPACLIGDMGRVKQVLLNIVGNAIKFTEQGSIRLIFRGERDRNDWVLSVEVRDTGIGIRPEDLSKMFVRFTQVDTKRNRKVEGTGLGLTISQKLCEMMGGHISVTSEYGKGTSFMVTIRQGASEPAPVICPVKNEVALLVCESAPILQTFEASCMKQLGLRYTMCSTTEEFEAKLRAGNYTHALASRAILRSLSSDAAGHAHLIGLLALREHSLIDTEGTNIYLPLFAVQLSYALNGVSENFRAARHSNAGTDKITPMPHVSVLIVDDNELNVLVAEGLMAPFKMQIDHVYSGKDALRAVQNREYDLVLMDHMMPEMDGVEATRLIRELPDEKYHTLPIVALTANTTSEARQMFLDRGFNEFLAKPIETDKLNMMLKVWLLEINDLRAAEHPDFQPALPDVEAPTHTSATPLPAITDEVNFSEGQRQLPSHGFYMKVLNTYVRSTREKLAALPGWMETDPARVVIEVHGLKSASASIGAASFSEAARKLEMQGKQQAFDAVKADLPAFIEHGQRVLAEIERFIMENTAPGHEL